MKSSSPETPTKKLNPGFNANEGKRRESRKGIWLLKPDSFYGSFSDRD